MPSPKNLFDATIPSWDSKNNQNEALSKIHKWFASILENRASNINIRQSYINWITVQMLYLSIKLK